MLTDEQIDYLLQIRDTTPPLPERTVRVMLHALGWSPETVEHALDFLKQPPAPKDAMPPPPVIFPKTPVLTPSPKPVSVKQHPFPVGSPLIVGAKKHAEKNKKPRMAILEGALVGLIVFIFLLILYSSYAREAGSSL